MKKVLFILGSMDVGGVQSGIMNFARLVDPEETHIDVLVHTKKQGFHEPAFSEYGTVYHIPTWEGASKYLAPVVDLYNNLRFYAAFKRFLRQHEYDVVHSKSLGFSAAAVKAAKKAGVSIRIAQSHVDMPDRLNPFARFYYGVCARVIERNATCKLAVSPKAIDLMFCKYGGRVIRNPTISLERLDPRKYPAEPHEDIRLIQIGTYSNRKNQIFSARLLRELLDAGAAASLCFVGYPLDEPEYIHKLEKTVEELGLTKQVRFLPKDSDVPLLLSQSDYMLIPSLREGLPNVALESQAMGVPVFISDAVYRQTDCGLCTFLSLEDGPKAWAEQILSYRKEHGTEKRCVDMSAWDNKNVVKEYLKIWNGEEG